MRAARKRTYRELTSRDREGALPPRR